MSGLPGFGLHITFPGGNARQWYAGADGVKRWADNDKRLGTDSEYYAAMQQGIPPMRPDDLEASEGICAMPIQHDNTDISVSQWAYADIANTESDIKGSHDDDRR